MRAKRTTQTEVIVDMTHPTNDGNLCAFKSEGVLGTHRCNIPFRRRKSFLPPIELVQLFLKLFQLLPGLTQLAFGGESLIIG